MNIDVSRTAQNTRIQFDGEISIHCITDVYQQVCAVDSLFDKPIVIDLSQVMEIDAAGIQLLLYLHSKASQKHSLSILKPTASVDKILRSLGMHKRISIEN